MFLILNHVGRDDALGIGVLVIELVLMWFLMLLLH